MLAEMRPSLQGSSPGSDVVLTCNDNSGDSNAVVSWSREDGTPITDGGRFSVSSDGGRTLTISSAEASDSGVYVCSVVTSQDGTLTGRGEVIIGEFEESLRLSCDVRSDCCAVSVKAILREVCGLPDGALLFSEWKCSAIFACICALKRVELLTMRVFLF